MYILNALSPVDWLRLMLALLLYLGPGYALVSYYPAQRGLDKTMRTALAIAVAFSFWSLLLAWSQRSGIRFTFASTSMLALLGWGVAFVQWWRTNSRFAQNQEASLSNDPATNSGIGSTHLLEGRNWSHDLWHKFTGDANRLLLWLIVLGAAAVNGLALGDTVVAPGSDGYHHTLFAQLIAEQGGLPRDLLPLTPVASFTYHFGFHGFVATIIWLTGISLDRLPAVALTPLLGQILKAVVALSTAFFAESIIQDRKAGPISAVIVGLIAVFPAYLVNWGRDTQLASFVIAPIFLALFWQWTEQKQLDWRFIPMLALLAAGITLTHYRITIMLIIGCLLVLFMNAIVHRWTRAEWLNNSGRLALLGSLLVLLVMPWFWHVYTIRKIGYALNLGAQDEGTFNLARLGDGVFYYPTNLPLLSLLLLALILGWWQRVRVVILFSIWAVLLIVLSGPRLLGLYMDTVTVVTSLYFVIAVIIGWFGAMLLTTFRKRRLIWLCWVVLLGFGALTVQGGLALAKIVEPNAAYVKAEDLPAILWIRQNTPSSAYFMVNTFHFASWPDYVIGSDAGFWLPVLAKRRTVTAPMTYSVERNIRPDYGKRIAALDQLKGDLTSPTALHLLKQEGVTYVYIGERGGPIAVQALLHSPAFKLEFQHKDAYVFRFMEAP